MCCRGGLSDVGASVEHMFVEAVEVRDRLAVLVDRLDPDAVSGTAARELWAVLDAAERLCVAGKTLLARRIAATHRPQTSGSNTAAEDMARRAGISSGAAKDVVDTSKRLLEQPEVAAALRRGELSAAQAALVSAAAAANPGAEPRLVELAARVSVPELRAECARVRAAADPDPDATNRRLHAGRRLHRWVDGDGFWNLHAKGTPQAGAAVTTVLDQLTDQIFTAAYRAGNREPAQAYAFDALLALADHTAQPGTDPAAAPAAADQPAAGSSQGRSRRSVNPRYLALLRIDVEALHRGRVQGDELCEIAGVGPVPVPVAEGLLGQAVLDLVITRGTDVLNVTHLGRGPTAAQRVALLWRNPACTVEGCWRTRTENDHREPWAETRHTRLDQLDPLCPFHHHLKTRHGWALAPGSGKRPMMPPDDPRHPRHRTDSGRGAGPSPPDAEDAASATTAAGGLSPSEATQPRGRARRRQATAAAQTSLIDPPGDPPKAA
jgi:hypothetical protein